MQSFVNGTNGRRSVVVLSCKQGIETATVTSVDEVMLHQYDVRVATPLACRATAEWQAKQLLAPLQGQCFRRAEGWWTYELCFERHLRQFHKDKDGRTDEYMLGEFGLEENARLEKAGQLLSRDKNTGRPVLQQAYSGGTHCGVRDEPRSASVHFLCAHQHNSDLASGGSPTSILSVTESPSCSYIVRVHTPLLCGHPHFREKAAKQAAMRKLHCAKDDVADAAPTKTN